jgi:ATP-dependent Clp protease ATP-binding subunit ClpA
MIGSILLIHQICAGVAPKDYHPQLRANHLSARGEERAEMVRADCRLDPSKSGSQTQTLEGRLRRLIVGQGEAITQIVNLFQTYVAGMSSPGRPLGNVLFLGPTGSGKTRLVEAFSESLFGSADGVVKIDCAEYQHGHEIAKLTGAPPGYLGHHETRPILTQEALNRYHTEARKISLVLFDEIEKASTALWNLLLGILDKASLMSGDNRKVDFSNTFIFMTSNLGAAEMEGLIRPRWGFGPNFGPDQGTSRDTVEKLSRIGTEAARRKFSPEFINRLDAMVVFNPLGKAELRQIVEIELRRIQERILTSHAMPFAFKVTNAAIEQLLIEGTDPRYGARPLRRAIERLLVQPISNLVASQQVRRGDSLTIDSEPSTKQMVFFKEAGLFHSAGSRG